MKLIAPDDFSWVTPLERSVEKGEKVDVPDDLVDGLVEQGWKQVSSKGAPPAPPAPNEEQ